MKPVEQRQLASETTVGDCWRCCLASILELDYEDVPHFVEMEDAGEVSSYWNATIEWLRPRGFAIAQFGLWGDDRPYLAWGSHGPLTVRDEQGEHELKYAFSAPGHWIAGVKSPRIDGLHAVVMSGSSVAFDPHPQRAMGHRGFRDATVLVAA